MHQKLLVTVLLSALALGACGKEQPPPQPLPRTEDDGAAQRAEEARLAAEAARADSIRRAEDARRMAAEAERRARASLTEMIHFGYDQFEITPQASAILRTKAEVMRANAPVRLRIEGHADERGSNEYNLALGMRRATAARDFLTNYGIAGTRFEVVSFGEDRPMTEGSNESAWSMNRRAEFHITAGGDDLSMPGTVQ